jgi:hypothetical protein
MLAVKGIQLLEDRSFGNCGPPPLTGRNGITRLPKKSLAPFVGGCTIMPGKMGMKTRGVGKKRHVEASSTPE